MAGRWFRTDPQHDGTTRVARPAPDAAARPVRHGSGHLRRSIRAASGRRSSPGVILSKIAEQRPLRPGRQERVAWAGNGVARGETPLEDRARQSACDSTPGRSRFIFCSFATARHALLVFRHAAVHPAPGRGAEKRRPMAESQAGRERHCPSLPPVRLCRHRQDHARQAHRRRGRRRGEVRRLHRQSGERDARQGLPRRLHHPRPDLPRARERRGNPQLRSVGRGAGLQGRADHHRRMLDGGRRARPRPVVVRRAAAGAGRSRAAAADCGRRLFHRGRAGRDADRGAPAGAGRSDRAAVDGYPRRRISRARPLRRDGSGGQRAISIRSACWRPTRCWSGATPRGAPTTPE